MNKPQKKRPKRLREDLRYETCRECGRKWNVSKKAVIPFNDYLCPQCWGKYRGR